MTLVCVCDQDLRLESAMKSFNNDLSLNQFGQYNNLLEKKQNIFIF